jgi:hypothetical protein
MPTLTDLRTRFERTGSAPSRSDRDGEALISDGRGEWTPKQFVESKLRRALTEMEQRVALVERLPVGER